VAALPDPRTGTKSGNFLTVSIVFVPTAKKTQMDMKEHHKKQVLKSNNYQYIST
jgi:hypothetical protein